MPAGALINVRVTPRGSRDEVSGWRDGVLQVRLKAAPVEGRANEALRGLLAKLLGLAATDVEVVRGATGRLKQVRVQGLTGDEMRARLGVEGA